MTQEGSKKYAEMARGGDRGRSRSRQRAQKANSTLVIKSKETQDSDIILKEIQKDIAVNEDNIKINKIRKIKDGIVAEMSTNEDLERFREKLAEKEKMKDYEIYKTKQKNPQIIIRNVNKRISEEELIQGLCTKNELLKYIGIKIDLKLNAKMGTIMCSQLSHRYSRN